MVFRRTGCATGIVVFLTTIAGPVSSQSLMPSAHPQLPIPNMMIQLPRCQGVERSYAAVATARDKGLPIEQRIRVVPQDNTNGAAVAAKAHNRIVREIYSHREWTPEEVADRWLTRCRADTENHGPIPPTVSVQTLL